MLCPRKVEIFGIVRLKKRYIFTYYTHMSSKKLEIIIHFFWWIFIESMPCWKSQRHLSGRLERKKGSPFRPPFRTLKN